jgi:two-component system, chemotaxis family, sensor kinase CheA
MEQFKNKFIEEALDLIQDLEKSALEISSDPDNKEHIEVIFRAMHSLKGGSAMFGFELIDSFTHQLEAAYDMVRAGNLNVDEKLLNLTFKAIDHIKILLADDDHLDEETLRHHEILLQEITAIVNKEPVKESTEEKPAEKTNSVPAPGATYYVRFIPKMDIMQNGTNPVRIVNELVSLGESITFACTDDIPLYNELDVLACYTSWTVVLHTDSSEDLIRDVFMFVDMDCELTIKMISNTNLIEDKPFVASLQETYKKGDEPTLEQMEQWLTQHKSSEKVPQPTEKTETIYKGRDQNISSIRVPSEKLDELINLVSELVTRQASLTLVSDRINNKELITIAEDIEKITRRLRDNTFGIRLIPIDNMVTRFQRLVRELSQELNKDIIFRTEGTDTELDKTIIEGLIDPLMHIIRNSIDHGIESAEERKALGKPEKGKILLKAYYSGANVFIQVSDDGKGIDVRKIFQHAVSKGIVTSDAELTEKEILDLTFLPGFSTAKNVTKVSGRGVGMDVVKRKISDLRGEISIDTTLNAGTTLTIKLPLTLSIIDGLLVKIDETFFVIPLATVDKCFEFKHEKLEHAVNNLIYINEGHIPFAYLRKEFEIKSTPPPIEQVIVAEYGDSLFGLAVDQVIGEYQAVLTSLGKMFNGQDIISGATILGDGTVALVMDPNKIISEFNYHTEEAVAQI